MHSTKNFFYEKYQKTFLCTLNHKILGYHKMPSAAKMVFTFYFLEQENIHYKSMWL